MPVSWNAQRHTLANQIASPVAVIMLFQIAALLIRSFAEHQVLPAYLGSETARYFGALVGFACLAMLSWPILVKSRHALRIQFQLPLSWVRLVTTSVALGAVLWLAQMLALLAITPLGWPADGAIALPSVPYYRFTCDNAAILLLTLPVMALLTPVVEELFSRGLIFSLLLSRGRLFAIILSAALFAVLHPLSTMPFAFIFGLFAAVQMLYYRTLWATIITHATVNIFVEISKRCIRGTWYPGVLDWKPSGPMLLIVLSFLACVAIACWLVTHPGAGAGPSEPTPAVADRA